MILYITPIRRKHPYTGKYKHECTKYTVTDDNDKEILNVDSIDLSNKGFKRGKAGVKQLLKLRTGIDANFDEVHKLKTLNKNY